MLTLFFCLRDCFRPRFVLQAEILALRHQLLVLQRSRRGHKLRLGWTDRFLWVWLSRLWNDWRSALLILKPETIIAWHRKGFRLYWRSLASPRWGAPRIHGELLKIGIEVSQATVAKFISGTRSLPPRPNFAACKPRAQNVASVEHYDDSG